MRIHVLAIGRLRSGPESALIDDYLGRFDKTGRALGLGPARVVEIEDRKGGGSEAEGALILQAAPKGAVLVALDERGQMLSSPDFAKLLGRWADTGTRDLAFAIGGADGHPAAVRDQADYLMSFGHMVWPHMLARVMLCEQLYRAASILAGGPYHRGG
ncbi:MAG: 23S rRNA (pseudouridine(1915)-N(3))-methyltransferase RlmH [Rhodovulum sulfidophilum]|uniref:Ribosomal RNA large subunit methyltransferase H n=1 Tax=Rhodovulum sulfidophilum TaxID=35806 RepID=A0A2W5PY77_RHOSU|nr:MAG: 23S rRNA (pseudouridine(1915)-N(3))-methyltransferase RlmH [Rhodovulum sulfidophilum]